MKAKIWDTAQCDWFEENQYLHNQMERSYVFPVLDMQEACNIFLAVWKSIQNYYQFVFGLNHQYLNTEENDKS